MDQDALLRELRAVFAEELRDELRQLSSDLAGLAARPHDAELAKSTHRRAHGLKGAARSVGEKAIEEACWEVEQRLRPVRDGHSEVTPELLDDARAGLNRIARAAAPLLGTPLAELAMPPRPATPAPIRPHPPEDPTRAFRPASLPLLPTMNLPEWGASAPGMLRPATPSLAAAPRPSPTPGRRPPSPPGERPPLDVFRSAMDGVLKNLQPSGLSAMPPASPTPVRPASPPPPAAPPSTIRRPEPAAEPAPDPSASLIDGTPLWQAWAEAMPAPEAPAEYALSADMAAQLRRVFLDELDDHLAELTTGLEALAAAPLRADLVANLFRSAHSLKGAARSTGERGIEAVGHRFEDVLSDIRAGRRAATPETVAAMHGAVQELAAASGRLRDNAGDGVELFAIAERLEDLPAETHASTPPGTAPTTGAEPAAVADPPGGTFRVASDRLDALLARSDELVGLPRRLDDRIEETEALGGLLRQGRNMVEAAPREAWFRRLEHELDAHAANLAGDRRRLAAGCEAIRSENG